MTPLLRRLLLLPLLAPLLAVLVVAALNPRPPLRLRLLLWVSPPLPSGLWLATAGLAGAALSATATALALRGGSSGPTAAESPPFAARRRSRTGAEAGSESWSEGAGRQEPWDAPPPGTAGPGRSPGEPPPTVSVPYRVVRQGSATAQATTTTAARAAWTAEPRAAASRSAGPASSDGSSADLGDWGTPPPGEDW
ncbi:hypothetical protein VB716_05845 [Synechococcus sp. CCY9201]|uniref:hypothetical protein n=1 Tax=unclassified Synechococcus TaxID=2626047 RepID=UPI002AD53906|nr:MULTISPECIES: hypothetical protein [unclassified Synechococcus]MEA5473739.1 hypothetical protein [Synechococcus sp. CCY9201]CAK6693806.1 hypothetical protein IFHNHDMJ_01497 [Synechococcus sp. CBW1107]